MAPERKKQQEPPVSNTSTKQEDRTIDVKNTATQQGSGQIEKHREDSHLPVLQRGAPEFLTKAAPGRPRGLEDLEARKDFTLPRLAICQSLTPQRKKDNPLYIKGLEEGNLFNTVTGEIYPDNKVQVAPLFAFKSRIYFADIDEGGGILCQSLNAIDGGVLCDTCAKCPNSQWTQDKEKKKSVPPACTDFLNYASIILPSRELIAVSMKSTAIKVAKTWNSMMRIRNRDTFAGLYDLGTAIQKNAMNEWYTFTVTNSGWVDETAYKFAENMYSALRDEVLKVDTTGLGGEGEGPEQEL